MCCRKGEEGLGRALSIKKQSYTIIFKKMLFYNNVKINTAVFYIDIIG